MNKDNKPQWVIVRTRVHYECGKSSCMRDAVHDCWGPFDTKEDADAYFESFLNGDFYDKVLNRDGSAGGYSIEQLKVPFVDKEEEVEEFY